MLVGFWQKILFKFRYNSIPYKNLLHSINTYSNDQINISYRMWPQQKGIKLKLWWDSYFWFSHAMQVVMEGPSDSAGSGRSRGTAVRLRSFLFHPRSHRSALKCRKVHGAPLATAEPGGRPRFLGFAWGSRRWPSIGRPRSPPPPTWTGAGARSGGGGARSRGKPGGTRPSGAPGLSGKTPAPPVAVSGPRSFLLKCYIVWTLLTRSCLGGGMEVPSVSGR